MIGSWTLQLRVFDYSQLSNYNFADWLMQNSVVYATIRFEEIVIVMINFGNRTEGSPIQSV